MEYKRNYRGHNTGLEGRQKMVRSKSLFTPHQLEVLQINGLQQNAGKNHIPVAHIEVKRLGYSFLITELDKDNPDRAFGFCDYDTDMKFSTFSLADLKEKLRSENLLHAVHKDFKGMHPIAVYAKVASVVGTVVTDDNDRLLKPLFESFVETEYSNPLVKLANLRL